MNSNTPEDPLLNTDPVERYLEGNLPMELDARLQAADQDFAAARDPGLSTLTSEIQSKIVEYFNSGVTDAQYEALVNQTIAEINRGIFNTDSLDPRLRDLLIEKGANITPLTPE